MERERLSKLGSMIRTNHPEKIVMKEGMEGTPEATDPYLFLINRKQGSGHGNRGSGDPARAPPCEGSRKGPSPRLYGHPGPINRVPVHSRGAAFPPSNEVQDAANRSVRWNKGSH